MEETKFSDIMRAYRNQPQAVNSVYREVLISVNDGERKYKDIIHFYNYTYVPEMTKFCINYLDESADVSSQIKLCCPICLKSLFSQIECKSTDVATSHRTHNDA